MLSNQSGDANHGECWLCGIYGHREQDCPNVPDASHRPSLTPRPVLNPGSWYALEAVDRNTAVSLSRRSEA